LLQLSVGMLSWQIEQGSVQCNIWEVNKYMLTVEQKFQIDKLLELAHKSLNQYEKDRYFEQIELIKKGCCPTCKRKLKK